MVFISSYLDQAKMSNFIIYQNTLRCTSCFWSSLHSALAKLMLMKMTFYFVIPKAFKQMESLFLLTCCFIFILFVLTAY